MISIIIASVNPALLQQLKENISDTIGVPYQIIAIENKENPRGICEVYNEGAEKSQYDILCFTHEDILFHSENWGKELNELLLDSSIGLVGAAGSTFKSSAPTAITDVDRLFYKNSAFYDDNSPRKYQNHASRYDSVIVLDGMFLACRKEVWKKFMFNEDELKGFHLYDVDFSLRVGEKYKLVVSNRIKIQHLSLGSFNKKWLLESIRYHSNQNIKVHSNLNASKRRLKSYDQLGYLAILFKIYKQKDLFPEANRLIARYKEIYGLDLFYINVKMKHLIRLAKNEIRNLNSVDSEKNK